MSTKNGNGILALLAGAAIGVGLGILFAPEKGSETRQKIKDGLDDLKDKAKSKMDSLEDETKEDLKDSIEDLLSNSSYKAEEAITFLEEKLAELKKQNAKLQK